MPRARTVPAIDEHYATEIRLFLDNDRALYDQKVKSFLPNIARKMISGKYDASKAWKLWMYLVDEAVRKYDVEHGTGGRRVQRGWTTVRVGSLDAVNKPTREAVAKELAADEEAALRGGEYGDLYTVAGRKPPKARANPRKPTFGKGDIVSDGYGTYKVVTLLHGNKYEVVAHPASSAYPSVIIKAGRDLQRANGARHNGSTFKVTIYGPSGAPIQSSGGYGSELTASEWGRLTAGQYGRGYTYKVAREKARGARKNAGSSKDWKNKTSGPSYNGHPSYAHWNAALWVGNEEWLYRAVSRMRKDDAVAYIMQHFPKTPDGVRMTKTLAAYAWRSLR